MKIVVLDGYTENPGDLSWAPLEKLGTLSIYDRSTSETIIERIGDAEVVLVNKVILGKKEFEACPNLKYIGVLATGYNVVDIEEATKYNIIVTNIPTYGTTAVSQFVFALLLELCRHVGHHAQRVAEGAWTKCPDFCFWDYPMFELFGKTLGIIGMGRIGYATAQIAKGFGMEVIAFDSYVNKEWQNEGIKYVDLPELLKMSDVVSLHCPLLDSTKEIINKKSLSLMKDGAILINTSRGPLINEKDVLEALNTGKLSGAAMDVLPVEPPIGQNKLSVHPNCLVTPHIAWAPKEARQRLLDIAVNNIESYQKGEPINIVN